MFHRMLESCINKQRCDELIASGEIHQRVGFQIHVDSVTKLHPITIISGSIISLETDTDSEHELIPTGSSDPFPLCVTSCGDHKLRHFIPRLFKELSDVWQIQAAVGCADENMSVDDGKERDENENMCVDDGKEAEEQQPGTCEWDDDDAIDMEIDDDPSAWWYPLNEYGVHGVHFSLDTRRIFLISDRSPIGLFVGGKGSAAYTRELFQRSMAKHFHVY
jgi:hypothetical protein